VFVSVCLCLCVCSLRAPGPLCAGDVIVCVQCVRVCTHTQTVCACVNVHTVWRRLIGCFKLQVIFRKKATNYRALLRKMTCEDKASYDSIICTQIR